MDGDYVLCESFYIDDGELDHLSRQECFALGVEYEMVRQLIIEGGSVDRPIHSANVERIGRLQVLDGRTFDIALIDDSWSQLTVERACWYIG